MKLSFRYFALVVMGAMICGCAEEVDDLQPTTNGTVTMKTTVSLDEHASTRALTEAGVKTFTAGDQIAVVYEQASGTATAVSVGLAADDITESGKKAAFTVTLSSPKANGKVRYIYPASRAATTIATTTAPNDDATIKYDALATQVGTFDKIASDLDLSVFDGEMTAQGNLPKTASLINPLTIGKFTIKNTSDADITNTVTKLTISDGTNTYTVNPSTLSTIYVAMKPIASSQTVTVNATDGTNNYTKSVKGNELAASNIYDITVKVIRKITYLKYTSASDSSYVDVLTTNATIWTGTVSTGDFKVSAGTYIVEGTATCTGSLFLKGEVNLILTNGSKLTVDGCIGIDLDSDYASLNIYGQGISSSMGQLIVNNTSSSAIKANDLTIHGGKVVANTTHTAGYGIYIDSGGGFTLYNGVLDASANDSGIGLYSVGSNPINIYNGTVTAHGGNASSYNGGCGICNENGSIIIKDAVVRAYGGAGTSARNGAEGILSKFDIEISGNADVYAEGGKCYYAICSNFGNITISGGKVDAVAGENASPLWAYENLTITTGITSVVLTNGTIDGGDPGSLWMRSGNVILGSKTYSIAQWGSTTITDNTTYSDYESSGLNLARSGKVLTFTKHE